MSTVSPQITKGLQNPKTYKIRFRKKTIGEIKFYTEFPAPGLRSKADRSQWWNIAETLNRVITPDMWKSMDPTQRKQATLETHYKMFPEWDSPQVRSKLYKAPNTNEIRKAIIKITHLCYQEIDCSDTSVLVLPSVRPVGWSSVGGSALSLHRIINLYVDGNRGWKRSLTRSLSHELMHVAYAFPRTGKHTLIDQMIREGLAEHFSEYITKQKDEAITHHHYATVHKALKKYNYWLNRELTDTAFDHVESETDIAHSIGYTMVGLFLKTMPSLDWYSITAASPQDIFKVGRWALDKKLAT